MQVKDGWDGEYHLTIMCLAETHIKQKDREKLKEKGCKKITMHILTKKVGKAI